MSADRWVLVPVEPTPEMIAAFQDRMLQEFGMRTTAGYHARVYAAMLAAAPAAPEPHIDGWPLYSGLPPAAPAAEPFVVKHYSGDERPCIKGNGFDGLQVGEDRDEAEAFVRWLNVRIGAAPGAAPAQSREPLTEEQILGFAEPFGAFEHGDAQGHRRLAFARLIERVHGIGSQP